jgi:hypothetical protein
VTLRFGMDDSGMNVLLMTFAVVVTIGGSLMTADGSVGVAATATGITVGSGV